MPIVKTSTQLAHYPYSRLEASARALLSSAAERLPSTAYRQGLAGLWKLLECYLAITSQKLDAEALEGADSQTVCMGFVGALRDDFLVGWSPATRSNQMRTFRAVIAVLNPPWKALATTFPDDAACDQLWKSMSHDPLEVEYWSGWWIDGPLGTKPFLNMTEIWTTLGPAFCRKTHQALVSYWAGRSNSVSNSRSLFHAFFSSLALSAVETKASPFVKGDAFSRIIRSFCAEYFILSHKNSLCLTTSRKRWNDWRNVVLEALVRPGIWPTPSNSIPLAGQYETPGSRTHLKTTETGIEVREKFITEIPLHISDDSAIELLIASVNEDKATVIGWCTTEADKLFARCVGRAKLASKGTDILVPGRIYNKKFTASAADIAATFEKHGLEFFQHKGLFGSAIKHTAFETAELLGIPLSGQLEPLMYLLIEQHPDITDAFLMSLRVMDHSGREVGVVKTDEGLLLIGEKRRKGSALAEQRVLLNKKSQLIIEKILLITTPLRDWMRSQGDKDCTYLFLSCAKGLSKPSVVRQRSRHNKAATQRNIQNLEPYTKKTGVALESLYARISLTTFRATTALTEYFSSGDEKMLARNLGHSRYKPTLLSHYLPNSFQLYFKARAIRRMQNLIITEALKGSEYLLEASDFSSMNDLSNFLKENTLLNIEDAESEQMDEDAEKILIDVGEPALTLLAAISRESKESPCLLNTEAQKWAEYADLLFAEIARVQHDSRLQERYERALTKSTSIDISRLVRVCD